MIRRFVLLFTFLILPVVGFSESQVIQEMQRDESPPMRDLWSRDQSRNLNLLLPNLPFQETDPESLAGGQQDFSVQEWIPSIAMPRTLRNFEGTNSHGYIVPDTNGEAGKNHYVQMVNRNFTVFNKNGKRLYGPVALNTLWSGFGGICEAYSSGDPVVVYDQLANRWVVTQFAFIPGGGPIHRECIAVSTTDDPAGSYYRYAFSLPAFNDYPKLGVWPDGYYTTFILRNRDFSVINGRICAYNRLKMLAGKHASGQCFDTDRRNIGLLPADLDGLNLPPEGSPHFSANLVSGGLNFWKTKINWKSPEFSSLEGPIFIPVDPYARACTGNQSCIPQPGIKQRLDSFSDRLMFRLAYRNFGDHESLVTNHTVDRGDGVSGIRWYEIRNPNSTPFIHQQGTYAPDRKHRWMGSAAMDRNGNLAIGYSISSRNVFPGIRYTGRLASDPKNILTQGEAILFKGIASQTLNRWGDYSDLTIDPTDDCTFWYTNQYIPQTGNRNWRTRIASFRFPSCK